jgi:hypothetical protein
MDDLLEHQLAAMFNLHPNDIELIDDDKSVELQKAREILARNKGVPIEDLIKEL